MTRKNVCYTTFSWETNNLELERKTMYFSVGYFSVVIFLGKLLMSLTFQSYTGFNYLPDSVFFLSAFLKKIYFIGPFNYYQKHPYLNYLSFSRLKYVSFRINYSIFRFLFEDCCVPVPNCERHLKLFCLPVRKM